MTDSIALNGFHKQRNIFNLRCEITGFSSLPSQAQLHLLLRNFTADI
jgi:hypothetical protein